ncbi:heme/copper-type cytochrome/quinol oxidase subunit 2 [Actinopolyspora biskrensis]|uniref:Heme/copper-type cytochrome/quinol oxidase subunit 2 n=1 Tax=Actinopolyspora biskrensis TaxID=1470178 RepID=A0A852YWH2_9ACTN|nr:heme/copper-type cytochrome/quinol oxidase subunit 2 [Actinopolyspora biskrensis]
MRKHTARGGAWLSALVLTLLTGGVSAHAAVPEHHSQAQATPLDALSTPVGLVTVVLGVTGMLVGALRRKKVPVQPENQRRT